MSTTLAYLPAFAGLAIMLGLVIDDVIVVARERRERDAGRAEAERGS